MSELAGMFGQLDAETGEASAPAENASQETSAAESLDDARLGEAHAALRGLLVDAKLKLLQFDDYKAFFARLVEPTTQALLTLENAQAGTIDLRRQLAETAAQSEELRARVRDIESQQTLTTIERDKLRAELDLARTEAQAAERARAELAAELSAKANAIEELERQLSLAKTQEAALEEDTERLRAEAAALEEKSLGLAAEVAAALDKTGLLETELQSLHKSLEDSSAREASATQRLTESMTAFAAASARLSQLESVNEELHAERDQLRAALDANGIRHDGQQSRLQMQVDAARARAAATERLLAEARQQLAERGEDIRASSQRHVESNYAREQADKRAAALEAESKTLRSELAIAKNDRDRLIERANVAANTLRQRDAQLQRLEEAARSAAEQTARLHTSARDGSDTQRTRISQLASMLERERIAHRTTKSALKATREERDKLQASLLELQLEANRRSVSNDTDLEFPPRGANAA